MIGSVHPQPHLILPNVDRLASPLVGIWLTSYHGGSTPSSRPRPVFAATHQPPRRMFAIALMPSNRAKFKLKRGTIVAISLGLLLPFLIQA